MKRQRIATAEVQTFEKSHIEEMRKMAPECMVLLKNDGTLPFEKPGMIALYGSGARRTIKGGTGSGDVNVRHFVTVEEGLENAGFTITTKKWLDSYDKILQETKADYFREIRKQADAYGVNPMLFAMGKTAPEPEYQFSLDGEGDTAIYVLARISGEGADRQAVKGDICLTDTEVRDILELSKKYKKFVLVLNVGGLVDLHPVEQVKTVLLMGQPGTPAGDALADVILGKSYPSGKLTMSWASLDAYPSTEGFGDVNDTDYREGIYVGYRYFDTVGMEPDYPFGFGLGYSTFKIFSDKVDVDCEKITVCTTVANTGTAPGKEVVQVYVSVPPKELDQPYQRLAGYAKTGELRPGDTEKLMIQIPTASLASYHEENAAYVLEQGIYFIRVGNSSRNTKIEGAFSLNADVLVEREKNIGGESGFKDRKPQRNYITYATEKEEKEAVQITELKAEEFKGKETNYQELPTEILKGEGCSWNDVINGKKTVDEFLAGLSDEELAWLCIGEYTDAEDLLEIIGNASKKVAGAAGETTGRLADLKLPAIVMADGPAGLRLSQDFTIHSGVAKGSASVGGDMLLVYTMEELQAMMEMEKADAEDSKTDMYHQYCVAIPIGTDIAQSWNDQLAQKCGDIVGEEMEIFGIHAWLAPALNIQRSPLCGRNFEYYSEDPFLSGCMAASVTKGVQQHDGCAATIKHFACNNQETNRFFSNSRVSERAMREIYLKGFEICVKEAQPHFIMTSYNLINGEHACCRKDLLTDVLRDEWGFQGVVMTDWLVTGGMGSKGEKWPCASAAGNIKAGNDLTMPGMPSDKEDILNALKDQAHPYALTKVELQCCAKRILEKIILLDQQAG